jgi:hypothetical protein
MVNTSVKPDPGRSSAWTSSQVGTGPYPALRLLGKLISDGFRALRTRFGSR